MATKREFIKVLERTGCTWEIDGAGYLVIDAPDHCRFNATDSHAVVIQYEDMDGKQYTRAQMYAAAIEDMDAGFYPCPDDCDCWIEDPADDIQG